MHPPRTRRAHAAHTPAGTQVPTSWSHPISIPIPSHPIPSHPQVRGSGLDAGQRPAVRLHRSEGRRRQPRRRRHRQPTRKLGRQCAGRRWDGRRRSLTPSLGDYRLRRSLRRRGPRRLSGQALPADRRAGAGAVALSVAAPPARRWHVRGRNHLLRRRAHRGSNFSADRRRRAAHRLRPFPGPSPRRGDTAAPRPLRPPPRHRLRSYHGRDVRRRESAAKACIPTATRCRASLHPITGEMWAAMKPPQGHRVAAA